MGDDHEAEASVTTEVLEQHRRLETLLEDVQKAFRADDGGASAREAFSRLRETLETHFEQEDRLYYPSIWALRPAQKAPLQACVAAHTRFRSVLHDISQLLEDDQLAGASSAFDAFAQRFESHEATEEAVLTELDRELGDTRPATLGEQTPS